MKSASLIVLTERFPYGYGESFLETELPYLRDAFDSVTIVPSATPGERRRPIPAGIAVEAASSTGMPERARFAACSAIALKRDIAAQFPVALHPRAGRRLAGHARMALRVRSRLARLIGERRLDPSRTLIYSYWLGAPALGAVLLKRRHARVRVVSRAHGFDLYKERHDPAYIPLQEAAVEGIDRVFAVSEHGYRYLAQRYPHLEHRCSVSRLGVEQPDGANSSSADGVLRVVSCSSLVAVKRVHLLVDGLRLLASLRAQPIEWHHLGDGPLRSGIEGQARASLPPSVVWTVHGQLTSSEVAEFYRSHPVDVFVNTSAAEGVPVSIMEAQSFGIPVIATAVGGTPEIVGDSGGVLLAAGASMQDLAQALSLVADQSPDAIARMRRVSRCAWHERSSAPANYGSFAAALAEMV